MEIPNDTGHPWRLDKFIEYQYKAKLADLPFLREYAIRQQLSLDECVMLCWYHLAAYGEITSVLLLNLINHRFMADKYIDDFWAQHKPNLVFSSSRIYAKSLDWFPHTMKQLSQASNNRPYKWLVGLAGDGDPYQRYTKVYQHLDRWKFLGRFSIENFLTALISMGEHGIIPLQLNSDFIDWEHGSNLASGIMNVYYLDEEANNYDRTGKLPTGLKDLVIGGAYTIYEAVLERYPNQENTDFAVMLGKMCSYRNLFKAKRYAGYHHDRQLSIIQSYQQSYPEASSLWEEMYDMRKKLYHESLLGEVGGWSGIRKERLKLFTSQGLLGVENIPG